MIVFITSIKHPKKSKSYKRVWYLLNNTLSSVCNQINQNFRIIVVHNKILPLKHNANKISRFTDFIEVDFPPTNQDMTGLKIDRGSKYAIGLVAAKKYNPDYIMFFDADDYIGNNISKYANENLNHNGWIISKGYYLLGNRIRERRGFNGICGTSNIYNYKLISSKISKKITLKSTQEEILKSTNETYLKKILGSHVYAKRYFENKGKPLGEFLDFCAIRVMTTGENHSDHVNADLKVIKTIPHKKKWHSITRAERKYFGIRIQALLSNIINSKFNNIKSRTNKLLLMLNS